MKIAVFHNLPIGGAKRVLYEEVKFLAKKHEVTLFQMSGQERGLFDLEKFAKRTYWFNFKEENNLPFIFNRLYSDYRKMVSLRKVHKLMAQRINDSNFDVVLIHPDWHTQSPYILRYLKTQKIYYCHELLRISYEKELEFNQDVVFFKKLYENIIRKVYKHIDMTNAKSSDIILVNSLFTKQNVFKAYGKDSVVCYPGVNSDFFRPISNLTKKTVLFAGDEEQIFGEEFKKKVSDSLPKKNTIQNFIRNKNGKDKKLVELYNRALVTVCITRNEPFGMIPLESMSCGVPVIGLNEGGYKETVLNDKTGVLISKNINEIRNAIDYFMKTPYNSSRMGKFARDYVKSKFTWEKHMKVLEETIQQ